MTFGYEFFIVFSDQFREVSIQFVLPFLLIAVIDIICNIITIAYGCFLFLQEATRGQKPSDIEHTILTYQTQSMTYVDKIAIIQNINLLTQIVAYVEHVNL
ncbi:hypothetical protein ACJX0J_014603 [Zea mays]